MKRALFPLLLLVLAGGVTPAPAAWDPDPYTGGNPVSTEILGQTKPVAVADGYGGTFVAWIDQGLDVFVQRLDRDGNPTWPVNGIAASVGSTAQEVAIAPDTQGGAIVVWVDRNGLNDVVRAQRINAGGTPQWAAAGVAVTTAGTSLLHPHPSNVVVVPDENGGAVMAYEYYTTDRFGVSTTPNVYLQRMTISGVVWFTAPGIAFSSGTGAKGNPALVPLGGAAVFAGWNELRSGNIDVYVQKFDSTGASLWTANGVLCSNGYHGSDPSLAPDGTGGLLVTWSGNGNILARRLNTFGTILWNDVFFNYPILVCGATGTQHEPVVTGDGLGGAIIAWTDGRTPANSTDIYAQHLNPSAAPQWIADGVALVVAPGAQEQPRIVSDGNAGALVLWKDWRGGDADLYGTHFTDGGYLPGGVPVAAAGGSQSNASLAPDGRGGAVAVWQDPRAGNDDVYAQRLDGFHYLGDPAPTILAIEDVPDDQGGKVKLTWSPSYLETDPLDFDYQVFRRVDPLTLLLEHTQISAGATEYSVVLDTPADSAALFTYVVRARRDGNDLGALWDSAPDSGYSVDNFPPSPVLEVNGVYGDGITTLTWPPVAGGDVAGYRVYRGDATGFALAAPELLATTITPGHVDAAGGPRAYRVTTVDRRGNESPPTDWIPAAVTTMASVPPVGPLAPNPARSGTALSYRLAARGRVSIGIWDVAGRQVRPAVNEERDAGEHRFTWDLRDGSGARVAPGVYFVRVLGDGGVLGVRSLVVVE